MFAYLRRVFAQKRPNTDSKRSQQGDGIKIVYLVLWPLRKVLMNTLCMILILTHLEPVEKLPVGNIASESF